MAPMRTTAGAPLPSIAKGTLKREAADCLCALVRRADQGEPPARQASLRRARRQRRRWGGRSQQVQLIRVDRVENFCAAPSTWSSRSRSRGRSRGTGGTMAPMSATVGAPLPSAPLVLPKARSKARPFNVFVPWCAELTRASLRRAMRAFGEPGELPARQATVTTLGIRAEQ